MQEAIEKLFEELLKNGALKVVVKEYSLPGCVSTEYFDQFEVEVNDKGMCISAIRLNHGN